jgi:hypothetical protein
MATFLSFLIFGLSICSLVFGIIILSHNKKERLNQIFFMAAIGSAVWGLGFLCLISMWRIQPLSGFVMLLFLFWIAFLILTLLRCLVW